MKCSLALNGTWREVSSQFYQALGYTESEIQAKPFLEIIHSDDRNKALALWDKLQNEEISEFESEFRFLKKSGSEWQF